ncbi:hypothetical protein OIU85_002041 [Salix viminalis]|uniref:CRM domain-containing protein n=1 Tax=Salix viminalis TaxID=40686 RepID=A0A9Q0VMW9_SALVM|nr:hypothetical protein OIU85_002041 [Salix viminalis]
MFAARNLQRSCFKTLYSLLQSNPKRNIVLFKDVAPKLACSNDNQPSFCCFSPLNYPHNGWSRPMSTSKGRSMRSKVERRMRKESGKTLREIRRAKKLKKKLMTDEERLIYNLKRAKKKVALLLQKLKKYDLPELPSPLHDPELLTSEQLQAYKKIGFRNKNYVPVGVRGVFGGVVQNMHMHWKFHETVQVCCDNFPKEKIKEMATMLARLSGGIVVNVHNVKTIIMFRGRNYRQPKDLIPLNTLTKRKALFKARFEQALESQKLNIKQVEQQLRRMGVNPEDPVAMASIQRVASTFFNAIDNKEGSPYVFRGDKGSLVEPHDHLEHLEPPADESDQEELDRFIAEIEDAADQEWAAEEAAEKEEFGRLRYWNREDYGGRIRSQEIHRSEVSDGDLRGARQWRDARDRRTSSNRDDESDVSEGDNEWNGRDNSDLESDFNADRRSSGRQRKQDGIGREYNARDTKRKIEPRLKEKMAEDDSESEEMLSDLDNAMWQSDAEEEHVSRSSRVEASPSFKSSSDEEEDTYPMKTNEMNRVTDLLSDAYDSDEAPDEFKISRSLKQKNGVGSCKRNAGANSRRKMFQEDSGSDDMYSDSKHAMWESDDEVDILRADSEKDYNYRDSDESEDHHQKQREKLEDNGKKVISRKEVDETWDSD